MFQTLTTITIRAAWTSCRISAVIDFLALALAQTGDHYSSVLIAPVCLPTTAQNKVHPVAYSCKNVTKRCRAIAERTARCRL